MALWGSSDNIVSAGIVTLALNGDDWEVTGVEGDAQFGQTAVGGAKTGDVIRFGVRGDGGVYFGDAVIVSIASSTVLTIGSTTGIENASGIAGTDYYISELPLYTVEDFSFSNRLDRDEQSDALPYVGTASTNSESGTDTVAVVIPGTADVIVGDRLTNDSNDLVITAIGATAVTLASNITAGIATGDTLSFTRLVDGYDKQVYGISTSAVAPAIYADAITHHGWVGIMTYIDCHGNLRVKSEVLVAAGKDANGSGGISTGTDGILYPTPK